MREREYMEGHGEEIMRIVMDSIVVDDGTGCWNWIGQGHDRKANGYATISINGKGVYIHRLMCPDISDDTYALHKCGNKSCVNPDHLLAGNQSQNMKDWWGTKKGVCSIGKDYPEECLGVDLAFDTEAYWTV